jgi:hypothetical protein
MNFKIMVFEKLIKFDRKLIKKHRVAYEQSGDQKYLEKIKMLEKHIEDQKNNIRKFR